MRLSLESCHTRRRDDPNIRWAQAVTASGPLAEQKVRGLSVRPAEELPGAPAAISAAGDVDGDAPRLVLGQHLGLQRLVLGCPAVDVGKGLVVCVADDIASGAYRADFLTRQAMFRELCQPHPSVQ